MIKISGSVRRTFTFPAKLPEALAFYADFDRTLHYLSHISIVRRYAAGQYRLLYETTELGIYHVRIFCDIATQIDQEGRIVRVQPLTDAPQVSLDAGMYALTGQGTFKSESRFEDHGDQTQIEYQLQLDAVLQTPISLRFMPKNFVTDIAQNVTDWRFIETVEGFIERSIDSYKQEKP
jgi:hypothetical protein